MAEQRERDWRGLNVRRNRKYEHLVEKLCTRQGPSATPPIFEFNKDLMVFAAMLGYSQGKKESLENESIQIVLGTYASDEKDGYIYLLALLEQQRLDCLRDENLNDSISVFEEYCNGGLSIIDQWMSENPQDLEGTDTLINHIMLQLVKAGSSDYSEGIRDPEF